jgi:hypothetical protein
VNLHLGTLGNFEEKAAIAEMLAGYRSGWLPVLITSRAIIETIPTRDCHDRIP